MIDNKFERCEPDDPNRCETVTPKTGQCPYKAIPEEKYCPRHIAQSMRAGERRRVSQYRLSKYQQRLEEFAEHDKIKCLRDEIGIARMMLEEIINQCNGNANQLLMFSNKISDLVMKIKALVESCHKLEKSTGSLLDKTVLINLAGQMLNIIGTYVDDTDIMESIADDVLKLITETDGSNAA